MHEVREWISFLFIFFSPFKQKILKNILMHSFEEIDVWYIYGSQSIYSIGACCRRGNWKLNGTIWLWSCQSVRHISKRVLCSVFCFCFCFVFFVVRFFFFFSLVFLFCFLVMWLKCNSFFFGTYFCQLKTRRAQKFF